MADKIRFTKAAINAIRPPESGRVYVYDQKQAGLCLSVFASGVRTFYRYGRIGGRPVRVKIGRWPDVTIENARKEAQAIAGTVARGIDPTRRQHGGKGSLTTLDDLFKHWLEHAKLRKKSWHDDERMWGKYFRSIRTRRIDELKTIVTVHGFEIGSALN